MFAQIREPLLPFLIDVYLKLKRESLTPKERQAQESFMQKLAVIKRKTKRPVVIAMVGLVGSGKSFIAEELARGIGAIIVEGDAIRVELRKQNEGYEGMRKISENVVVELLHKESNVVVDSDHIDARKRASLRAKISKTSARLFFVRVHADYDIMAGRIITARYKARREDFFGGASTPWNGSEQSRGAVVKLREMDRRRPHHYRWENKGGGRWVLRKLPFRVFATIDTSNASGWEQNVRNVITRINKSTQ